MRNQPLTATRPDRGDGYGAEVDQYEPPRRMGQGPSLWFPECRFHGRFHQRQRQLVL